MDTLRARAGQGDSDAAVSLGLLLSGSVLPDSRRRSYENPVERVRWFRHAAEIGDTLSMSGLGIMYSEPGNGVHDDVEALMWKLKLQGKALITA